MKKQRGMTFLGVVLMVAAIVFVAVILLKLSPAYLEYISVKRTLTSIASDPGFTNMGKNEIMTAFERRAQVDDIKSIKAEDLEILKEDGGKPTVSAEYQVVVPLMANVSALLDFTASTDTSSAAE